MISGMSKLRMLLTGQTEMSREDMYMEPRKSYYESRVE
jgi:hypothetical protein